MDKQTILDQIIQFITGFLSKGSEPEVVITIPMDKPAEPSKPAIDWTSPDCLVTPHFTVEDVCMLHNWNRLANELDGFNDQAKAKAVALCQKLEEVREFLACPMNIHCMFRSAQYNIEQKILLPTGNDVHAMMLAVDFDCNKTMTIEQVKTKLEPVLEKFDIRMEFGTTTWCHIDLHTPGPSGRYFHV